MFKRIAVLTSKSSWFKPYAKDFIETLKKKKYRSRLFFSPDLINKDFEIVFILSYFSIIEKQFLKKHRHNIVVHESNLPKGRGWAPLFWQILERKNKIPIVLFEAGNKIDSGNIYLKDYIFLKGSELNEEIRRKQAAKTMELCLKFLSNYENLKTTAQKGTPSFYKRRTAVDGKLNINKTIKEQFPLFRICDNEKYPAFFCYKKQKYFLKIYKI